MPVLIQESYRYCERIARSRARNFYYSFLLLPRPKRQAMCAIYAFMRFCDDLSDEQGASLAAMERWRAQLSTALAGTVPPHPLWPAFLDTVSRYRIPHEYFFEMIEGVSSDLQPRVISTFDELYRYCYQVASVVGLTIIHIFGFRGPEVLPLAEKCGIAFQITNILRDVKEDLQNGRVYLPAEDIRRFGADLTVHNAAFAELMRFEAARARAYYDESAPLEQMVDPASRPSLRALIEIYRRLLDRIENANYDVLSQRIRVPASQKLAILVRARLRV